jgi:hypothetical protein
MCMTYDALRFTPWSCAPLCRRHVLGVFNISAVDCVEATGAQKLQVIWGLSWIADGACEHLGAWVEPPGAAEDYTWTVESLACRGLERIRTVTGSDVGLLHHSIARVLSPNPARSFTEAAAMDRLPVFTGGMSAYRMEETEAFRVRLNHSLRRHGRFATTDAALAFVAGALRRMERNLDKHPTA